MLISLQQPLLFDITSLVKLLYNVPVVKNAFIILNGGHNLELNQGRVDLYPRPLVEHIQLLILLESPRLNEITIESRVIKKFGERGGRTVIFLLRPKYFLSAVVFKSSHEQTLNTFTGVSQPRVIVPSCA